MMGNESPAVSPYKLMVSVLPIRRENSVEARKVWKCFRPTHSLEYIPLKMLKLRNAICTPYMGKYLNTTIYMTGIDSMAYKSQLLFRYFSVVGFLSLLWMDIK